MTESGSSAPVRETGEVARATGDVTLTQIVAALSVIYTPEAVVIWLLAGNRNLENDESPHTFLRNGRIAEVAAAVRRIGDADPADFTVSDGRAVRDA